MRISTIVDTNVFVDVLGPVDDPHRAWSLSQLQGLRNSGSLVLSVVVWAELATGPLAEGDLGRLLSYLRLRHEDLPFAAAFPAGQAHRRYRERGGRRERTLPDFLIGAHALVAGHRLLTRDASRYRDYFPDLDIVCPETHA